MIIGAIVVVVVAIGVGVAIDRGYFSRGAPTCSADTPISNTSGSVKKANPASTRSPMKKAASVIPPHKKVAAPQSHGAAIPRSYLPSVPQITRLDTTAADTVPKVNNNNVPVQKVRDPTKGRQLAQAPFPATAATPNGERGSVRRFVLKQILDFFMRRTHLLKKAVHNAYKGLLQKSSVRHFGLKQISDFFMRRTLLLKKVVHDVYKVWLQPITLRIEQSFFMKRRMSMEPGEKVEYFY